MGKTPHRGTVSMDHIFTLPNNKHTFPLHKGEQGKNANHLPIKLPRSVGCQGLKRKDTLVRFLAMFALSDKQSIIFFENTVFLLLNAIKCIVFGSENYELLYNSERHACMTH